MNNNKFIKDEPSSVHQPEQSSISGKSTTTSPSSSSSSSSPSSPSSQRRHRFATNRYLRSIYIVLFRTLEGLLNVLDWMEALPGVQTITNLLETYLFFPSTTNIRTRMRVLSRAVGLGDIGGGGEGGAGAGVGGGGGGASMDGSFRPEVGNTNVNTNPPHHPDASNTNGHPQATNPIQSIPILKEQTLRLLTNKYGDSISFSSSFSSANTPNNNHFSTHPSELYRALRFRHNASEPIVITLMHDAAPQYIYLPHPLWTLAPLGLIDPITR